MWHHMDSYSQLKCEWVKYVQVQDFQELLEPTLKANQVGLSYFE